MTWLREAISDDRGRGDMAYIAIGVLSIAAVASVAFIFAMSAISYHNCKPVTTITSGEQNLTSVIPCQFDPLPVGQAIGLIFAAYATLIGSLSAYMMSTRRRNGEKHEQAKQ